MKKEDINIRDPFVLYENGTYYMYGTRAKNFGMKTGGFDVYISADLEEWSAPHECFNSEDWCLNDGANWAPEVHKYNGMYYMFASFMKPEGLRGTYILVADSPLGPFAMHSPAAVTPKGWECIDGTFYVEDGVPYIIFCHEHTQVVDGGMCILRLSDDLKTSVGEPADLFFGSSPYYIEKSEDKNYHYITDGPFMYKAPDGELLMLWSTCRNGYVQCLAKFEGGTIKGSPVHLDPIFEDDGGHGMLFNAGNDLYLTLHAPNRTDYERPVFIKVKYENGRINRI